MSIDTVIFDGKSYAAEIDKNTIQLCNRFMLIQGRKPVLLIVNPGNSEESAIYARAKSKKAEKLSIRTEILNSVNSTEKNNILVELENHILRNEPDGIFVERPLPSGLSQQMLENTIPDYLDVEGASSWMQGRNLNGTPHVIPATAEAVLRIIESLNGVFGKDVCIINRTPTVGKPLSMALLNKDYTVTICHSKTENLKKHTMDSGIVVTATGKPSFLNRDMISENSAIVDVGITSIDGKICGDVDVKSVEGKAGFITPVPGGVGPVTSSIIMENLLKLCLDRIENRFRQ